MTFAGIEFTSAKLRNIGWKVAKPLSCLLLTGLLAFGGTVSPQLGSMEPNQSVQVIVQYTPSLAGSLLSTVCGTLNLLELLPGGELCSTTVSDAVSLANNPAVAHVSVNNLVQAMGAGGPVYDYTPETLRPLSANSGSADMSTGASVGVALIDSGIHVNQDLVGNGTNSPGLLNSFANVRYAESFVPNEGIADYYGHGTHIAGIIAGNGSNSYGSRFLHDIHGVAPGVHLINLKVLNRNGESNDAEIILAIDRAIQLRSVYNIKVINLSLGRPIAESYRNDPLCQEVEKAWLSGITVVIAAGNGGRDNSANTNGYGTISAPGNDPLAITVGAMNTEGTPARADDLMTTYSSKGPTLIDMVAKPDLVAPGNKIFSILVPGATLETTESSNLVPLASYVRTPVAGEVSNYFILNGTSMAAGVASGAAAALLDSQNLTPDQVKARLMLTATKNFPQSSVITDPTTDQTFTVQYDIFTVGAGYLDLDAAMASTATIPANENAASPIATIAANTLNPQTPVYIVNDSAPPAWGSTAVWGSSAVWGSTAVWGSSTEGGAVNGDPNTGGS